MVLALLGGDSSVCRKRDPPIVRRDRLLPMGVDEYDEIDGHLVINHEEHYVVGDAHTNSYENHHSFLRNWLQRFRGVSKHHLQGYLDFLNLTLNTDQWFEKILSTDFYRWAFVDSVVEGVG